jgi:hypothetical protein
VEIGIVDEYFKEEQATRVAVKEMKVLWQGDLNMLKTSPVIF